MNDWKKRRDAIAWSQREVSGQMGIAGAAKDEKEVDRLVGTESVMRSCCGMLELSSAVVQ